MKNIRNIVFDFGGVLIDWNPEYLYRKVFEKEEDMHYFLQNICTSEWNLKQDCGRPFLLATKELQDKYPRYADEIALFYTRWKEMLGGEIYDNTKLIKPLKEKYHVYGLTNWSAETFGIAYDSYDFLKNFEGIVVSGEEKLVKPDVRLYNILFDRFKIVPDQSLFIDDNAVNIDVANKLGMSTIHLTPDINLEQVLIKTGIL